MAKRLQVQGPQLRSQQTRVIAPMVDTYFREQPLDPTQLEAVKLADFVTEVVNKGSDLALNVKKKKTEDALLALADYSLSQGDTKTFEEVADELGIVKNDETAYAFHTMRGEREGQVIANKLQQWQSDNFSTLMDAPNLEEYYKLIQEEHDKLVQASIDSEKGSFGFGAAVTKATQGRLNQITQTFASQHTAARKEERAEAASITFGYGIDTRDMEIMKGNVEKYSNVNKLSNSEKKEAILNAALSRIQLYPEQAQGIVDFVSQYETVKGSTLGDIPEVQAKLDTAIEQAQAAIDAKDSAEYTRKQTAKRDEILRLDLKYEIVDADGVVTFLPYPDDEYNPNIWDSIAEFERVQMLRVKNNDDILLAETKDFANFNRIKDSLTDPTLSFTDLDERAELLKAGARNQYEYNLVNTITNDLLNSGVIKIFEEPVFKEYDSKLKILFKYANDIRHIDVTTKSKEHYNKMRDELENEYYTLRGQHRKIVNGEIVFDTTPVQKRLDEWFKTVKAEAIDKGYASPELLEIPTAKTQDDEPKNTNLISSDSPKRTSTNNQNIPPDAKQLSTTTFQLNDGSALEVNEYKVN